ncbi:MAG: hypothetical protein O2782_16235 [bacterium]|nr:hypothetical protein [bacterium]
MMSQAISSSIVPSSQAELISVVVDGLSAACRQALTGMCLGAVGLSVILSVTAVLIGAVELGIVASGPAVPPGQILLH